MDRLRWVCLGNTRELQSSRQLGVRVWAEINPGREEIGRQPGFPESRAGEDSARETYQLLQCCRVSIPQDSRALLGLGGYGTGQAVAWIDTGLGIEGGEGSGLVGRRENGEE